MTIEDVAAAAGVSRQTVSRALNNMAEIKPETRQRVLATIERLDYRPNAFARGMKTRKSNTIGLIVSDISNPFYPAVARGLFDAAETVGWNVVVYNTDLSRRREESALNELIARGADGVVGFFYALDDATLARYAGDLPMVVSDRPVDHAALTSVTTDFGAGIRAAVEHLVASGHQQIGMLDSTVGVAADERREAFVEQVPVALPAADLAGHVIQGPPTIPGGTAALHELLNARPEITAVVAFNDLMAIGAIHAARERGLAVPSELAVVGFDDLSIAPYVFPPLTTVHTDKYAHGRRLADVLHQLTAERTPDRYGERPAPSVSGSRVVLPATLIVRESA
ncbi:substrate-binding domain-containing protein [Kribbella italica]|uniref:LacI family transcriptional regulator n=1 Tax=Kribbella italica TaxID=1540520 RepID=A0A7W9J5G2_9ACTN|nr:LacI family transcriptional regulator [Kribbella italica]